jgi:hypothetical protein
VGQSGRHDPAQSSDSQYTAPARDSLEPTEADHEQRQAMIAVAAYYRAEQRGFAPGCEMEDWLAAQAEVDALLKSA